MTIFNNAQTLGRATIGLRRLILERWRVVLGSTGFAVVAFIVALLLFNWTWLTQAGRWSLREVFAFMFVAWASIIVLLFIISLCLPRRGETGGDLSEPSDN